MTEEFVREMNAEERASLQRALEPQPNVRAQRADSRETWGLAAVWILTLAAIAATGRANVGGLAAGAIVGAVMVGRRLVRAPVAMASNREFVERHTAQRAREIARILEDGRVTVRRVRAVAVVEIEPLEDEGTGYVFDLGDGRVLFIKGEYFRGDGEAPWPNSDFEIVRTMADGEILGVHCHGTALPPLRVVPSEDVDPERGWDEREEVLHMSVDEAVRTVLHDP